jgi:hypothetical protein
MNVVWVHVHFTFVFFFSALSLFFLKPVTVILNLYFAFYSMPPRKTTAARGRTQGRTTRNQQSSIPSSHPREEAVPVVPINAHVAHVRELRDHANRLLATMDQTSLPQGEHIVPLNDEPQIGVNLHHNDSRNLSYLDYRREFYIFNPPTFDGTTDPTKADTWLYTIEEGFNNLEVPNGHRVK